MDWNYQNCYPNKIVFLKKKPKNKIKPLGIMEDDLIT